MVKFKQWKTRFETEKFVVVVILVRNDIDLITAEPHNLAKQAVLIVQPPEQRRPGLPYRLLSQLPFIHRCKVATSDSHQQHPSGHRMPLPGPCLYPHGRALGLYPLSFAE